MLPHAIPAPVCGRACWPAVGRTVGLYGHIAAVRVLAIQDFCGQRPPLPLQQLTRGEMQHAAADCASERERFIAASPSELWAAVSHHTRACRKQLSASGRAFPTPVPRASAYQPNRSSRLCLRAGTGPAVQQPSLVLTPGHFPAPKQCPLPRSNVLTLTSGVSRARRCLHVPAAWC